MPRQASNVSRFVPMSIISRRLTGRLARPRSWLGRPHAPAMSRWGPGHGIEAALGYYHPLPHAAPIQRGNWEGDCPGSRAAKTGTVPLLLRVELRQRDAARGGREATTHRGHVRLGGRGLSGLAGFTCIDSSRLLGCRRPGWARRLH